MTLTELKYIVAVAREKHFGRASEACFVSQPTLSVAIKKLEEELGVAIFERGRSEIGITEIGQQVINQAQKVLEESEYIKEIAKQGHNPLEGPLKVGVIHTIGPYLLPYLVPTHLQKAPQMPLILQENFTAKLLELLRLGELDCAIMALPIPDTGLNVLPLYDEDFVVAVPKNHEWSQRNKINGEELKDQTMLLLGTGHCFRDQVLEVCPELSRFSSSENGFQRSFEGSSLETIRHMVAAGLGITLLPKSSLAFPLQQEEQDMIKIIALDEPVPNRQIVLAWRRSFTRHQAMEVLIESIHNCRIPNVKMHTEAQISRL